MTTTVEAPAAPDAAMAALVARVQAGDTEAFGGIYRRYHDTVWRFVYARTRHRQTTEDLTGDVFLRALQRIDTFRWQGRDLGAWLITIAHNRVADHHKGGFHHYETTTASELDASRFAPDCPEDEAINYMLGLTLWAAVLALPPEQSKCLQLRFLHGYSIAETGTALATTNAAIKARAYRAYEAIRNNTDLARTLS